MFVRNLVKGLALRDMSELLEAVEGELYNRAYYDTAKQISGAVEGIRSLIIGGLPDPTDQELADFKNYKMVEAIKSYRRRVDVSMIDAKFLLETKSGKKLGA